MGAVANIVVIHNGYKLTSHKSMDEVNKFMEEIVAEHANLRPKKICDRTVKRPRSGVISERLVQFEYYTLYREVFVVEVREY